MTDPAPLPALGICLEEYEYLYVYRGIGPGCWSHPRG